MLTNHSKIKSKHKTDSKVTESHARIIMCSNYFKLSLDTEVDLVCFIFVNCEVIGNLINNGNMLLVYQ